MDIRPDIFGIAAGADVGVRVRWAGLSTGDIGAPISKPEFWQKTVQITGEMEDGNLEGTNTPEDPASWMVMLDAEGNRLTRPRLYYVTMNPLHIRPNVRRGHGVAFDVIYTR